ncbi:MAG: GxxExxY protein [Ferruginibacter sp.]
MEYKYSDVTEKILRAAMNVHGVLGNGFQEVIYQRALEIEFRLLGLNFSREVNMPIFYKGTLVGERRVDFLVEGKICVELKAVIQLENVHLAQGKNYLEAFNLEIGLLINFGANSLEWKRLFNNKFRA